MPTQLESLTLRRYLDDEAILQANGQKELADLTRQIKANSRYDARVAQSPPRQLKSPGIPFPRKYRQRARMTMAAAEARRPGRIALSGAERSRAEEARLIAEAERECAARRAAGGAA